MTKANGHAPFPIGPRAQFRPAHAPAQFFPPHRDPILLRREAAHALLDFSNIQSNCIPSANLPPKEPRPSFLRSFSLLCSYRILFQTNPRSQNKAILPEKQPSRNHAKSTLARISKLVWPRRFAIVTP